MWKMQGSSRPCLINITFPPTEIWLTAHHAIMPSLLIFTRNERTHTHTRKKFCPDARQVETKSFYLFPATQVGEQRRRMPTVTGRWTWWSESCLQAGHLFLKADRINKCHVNFANNKGQLDENILLPLCFQTVLSRSSVKQRGAGPFF